MKRRSTFISGLATAAVGGLIVTSGGNALASPRLGAAPAAPTITIGFAGPLSGDQAYFGQGYLNGVKLQAQTFTFSGALAGAKVKVMPLDDVADPQQGVTVARRFVAMHINGIIGHFNSGVTIPTEPIYHTAGIPQITVSSNPKVTTFGFKNLIRLGANDNVQGVDMARIAKETLGVKSVAVFNDSQAFGQGVASTFYDAARKDGLTIYGNTALSASTEDYTSALNPVLAKHPSAIYFGGTIPVGGPLCKQARAAGFKGAFMGADGLFDPAFIKGCGPSIGTAYVTVDTPPYDSSAALRQFSSAYKKSFGAVAGPYSIYGYDQMGFLLSAMNAAGTTSSSAVIDRLHSITYKGVLGAEKVDARGELINAPIYIYKVSGAGFSLVRKG